MATLRQISLASNRSVLFVRFRASSDPSTGRDAAGRPTTLPVDLYVQINRAYVSCLAASGSRNTHKKSYLGASCKVPRQDEVAKLFVFDPTWWEKA